MKPAQDEQACGPEQPTLPGCENAAAQHNSRAKNQARDCWIEPGQKTLCTTVVTKALILVRDGQHQEHCRGHEGRRCNQRAGESRKMVTGKCRQHGNRARCQITLFHAGPCDVRACVSAVAVLGGHQGPAVVLLAEDVCLSSLALGVERVYASDQPICPNAPFGDSVEEWTIKHRW